MVSLTLSVKAPEEYRVPTCLQVVLPANAFEDKVRSALRSPFSAHVRPRIDSEILTFTKHGHCERLVPAFVGMYDIKLDTLRCVEGAGVTISDSIVFRTHDGRVHEVPFSGGVDAFIKLLCWKSANSRYVICVASEDRLTLSGTPYLIEVGWIGPFPHPQKPRPSRAPVSHAEGCSQTSLIE